MFNLFLFITELNIAYYADDTTLYECKANLIEVQTKKQKTKNWNFESLWMVSK